MAKYVVLINWTDQGVREAKDTVRRYEQARASFEQMGARIETVLWTMGRYDIVAVVDAPDDETATAAVARLGSGGYVRTETLRAFTADEVGRLLQRLG
jgi:uncharacterized protein with GYD domain